MEKRSSCTAFKLSSRAAFILSSVVCLLPVVLAVAVYDNLPERIVMQWNFKGEPNWDAPKAVGAFALPLVLTVGHIITLLFLYNDPKWKNHPKALRTLVGCTMPFLSVTLVPVMLFHAMGVEIPIIPLVMFASGLVFILYGNYLPKCRQNYVMGIRLPWTLNDADNWNKTHQLAGVLWVVGGAFFIAASFVARYTAASISNFYIVAAILSVVALMAAIPVLHSYSLYKKSVRRTQKEVV